MQVQVQIQLQVLIKGKLYWVSGIRCQVSSIRYQVKGKSKKQKAKRKEKTVSIKLLGVASSAEACLPFRQKGPSMILPVQDAEEEKSLEGVREEGRKSLEGGREEQLWTASHGAAPASHGVK